MSRDAESIEEFGTEECEFGIAAVTRARAGHGDDGPNTGTGSAGTIRILAEQNNPVGEVQGLVDVVGDEHDSCGFDGVNLEEQILHGEPCEGVECTEGFVEHQHPGAARQRPGERGTLRHSAGDLSRAQARCVGELDKRQQFGDALASFVAGGTPRKTEFNISGYGAPGKKSGLLEGDRAALVDAVHRDVIDVNGSGVGCVEATDLTQQGRLAAAGGSEERDDLTRGDVQGDVAEDCTAGIPGAKPCEAAADAGKADGQGRGGR
jgi:hypothetical protein